MFFLITGWIIGLGTGIAGLVFSIIKKKNAENLQEVYLSIFLGLF